MRLINGSLTPLLPTLMLGALATLGMACDGGGNTSEGNGGSAGAAVGGAGGEGGGVGGEGVGGEGVGGIDTTPYSLTVADGSGSGEYTAGEQVHVFAHVNPYQAVVDGWQSSVATESPSGEWHFVFTMPASDVTLTPNVVAVPMNLTTMNVAGVNNQKEVRYAVPTNPQGVLFTFHGTGGSADIIENSAMQYIARKAFHQGYAVVSTEAEERTLNDGGVDGKIRWNSMPDLATNIDLQNIQLISDGLSAQTNVPASAPRFAVGMSNGGGFAVTVGAMLPFTAVTSLCATGRVDAADLTETPTQWLMCEQDTNETVSAKKEKWPAGSQNLAARSIATDYDVLQPAPIFDLRFARTQGVGNAKSTAAYDELVGKGMVDTDGWMQVSAVDIMADYDANTADWPAMKEMVDSSSYFDVKNSIKHPWADHTVHDDWTTRILDFMQAQLP